MPSHTSTPSNTSNTTHAVSEGFSDLSRDQVAPYILTDLRKGEDCNVDTLLGVFLDCCHPTDTTPRAQQTAGAFHNSQPSTLTTEATPDPTPLAPEPQAAVVDHLAQRELLEACLDKVTLICEDSQLQEFIQEYQQGRKETTGYEPFAKLANFGLQLINTLELPDLHPASEANILFHVGGGKQIPGRGRSKCSPDLIVVSQATATQVHNASSHKVTKPRKKKSSAAESGGWFEWPD
ncbi:hypothetical protein FRC11_013872, partial [Ceratobasidium sp. 423]